MKEGFRLDGRTWDFLEDLFLGHLKTNTGFFIDRWFIQVEAARPGRGPAGTGKASVGRHKSSHEQFGVSAFLAQKVQRACKHSATPSWWIKNDLLSGSF